MLCKKQKQGGFYKLRGCFWMSIRQDEHFPNSTVYGIHLYAVCNTGLSYHKDAVLFHQAHKREEVSLAEHRQV